MDKSNYCVRVTDENRKELQDHIKLPGNRWSTGAYYGRRTGRGFHGNQKAWTELSTIEEFRQHILNEPIGYEIY